MTKDQPLSDEEVRELEAKAVAADNVTLTTNGIILVRARAHRFALEETVISVPPEVIVQLASAVSLAAFQSLRLLAAAPSPKS